MLDRLKMVFRVEKGESGRYGKQISERAGKMIG